MYFKKKDGRFLLKKLLILLLLLVLVFSSCKKEEAPEPTIASTPRAVVLSDEQALNTIKERLDYSDDILYVFKGRIEKDGTEYFHVEWFWTAYEESEYIEPVASTKLGDLFLSLDGKTLYSGYINTDGTIIFETEE